MIEKFFAGLEGEFADDGLLSEDDVFNIGVNIECFFVESGEFPLSLEGIGVDGYQKADQAKNWKNIYHFSVII